MPWSFIFGKHDKHNIILTTNQKELVADPFWSEYCMSVQFDSYYSTRHFACLSNKYKPWMPFLPKDLPVIEITISSLTVTTLFFLTTSSEVAMDAGCDIAENRSSRWWLTKLGKHANTEQDLMWSVWSATATVATLRWRPEPGLREPEFPESQFGTRRTRTPTEVDQLEFSTQVQQRIT